LSTFLAARSLRSFRRESLGIVRGDALTPTGVPAMTRSLFAALVACSLVSGATPAAEVAIKVDKPGHRVAPTLWGIFFEDINLSADGGIYPELVRNRSFNESDKPDYWKLVGGDSNRVELAIDDTAPLNPLNRTSLRVRGRDGFTLENEGYWGMNVVEGTGYTLRLNARAADGYEGPVTVRIVGSDGDELAKGTLTRLSSRWRQHTLDLTASASDTQAKLQIEGAGGQGAL
jgi:hypothetical protein